MTSGNILQLTLSRASLLRSTHISKVWVKLQLIILTLNINSHAHLVNTSFIVGLAGVDAAILYGGGVNPDLVLGADGDEEVVSGVQGDVVPRPGHGGFGTALHHTHDHQFTSLTRIFRGHETSDLWKSYGVTK